MILKQLFMHVFPYLPFISAAVVSTSKIVPSALVAKLLEAGIIAGIVLYANVQTLKSQYDGTKRDIQDVKVEIVKNRSDITNIRLDLAKISTKLEK